MGCDVQNYKKYVWDNQLEPHVCPECGGEVEIIVRVVNQATGVAKFSMMSRADKQASLKKRAKDHTNRTAREKITEMNRPDYKK